MKNIIYKGVLALFALAMVVSCDEGFEDLNEDPTKASQIDVKFKFPNTVLFASGQRYETWRGNLIYCSTMMQHLANTQGYWSGDKYFWNAAYSSAFWDAMYPQAVKTVEDMKFQLETEELTSSPEYAMVRILRVFIYHRLTDLYGDIPYSEAGKAFIEGNTRPKYDAQEDIYADMLKELEESVALLGTGTAEIGTSDILFLGNQDQWKKWGNSLMLRLALRLVKVDETAAQAWATKAINGGVMESNADIAYVQHEDGNGILQNANGEVFTADRSARISTTFLGLLENDPRMRVYAALPPDEDTGFVNDDPAAQKGLPNGLDGTTIQDYEGGDDLATYSEPNSKYLMSEAAPMFWQTYAEVELMLAEAGVRWGLAGDPAAHYEAGVTAAMEYLEMYNAGAAIDATEIADYLAANPFDAANALEQINTEYYKATFLNEYETYANWRRTGFPNLTPVNYPGNQTNGTIPRRLIYPTNEQALNKENYDAVIASQGADLLTTRVWWDQ